jgi:hypothetical protein
MLVMLVMLVMLGMLGMLVMLGMLGMHRLPTQRPEKFVCMPTKRRYYEKIGPGRFCVMTKNI